HACTGNGEADEDDEKDGQDDFQQGRHSELFHEVELADCMPHGFFAPMVHQGWLGLLQIAKERGRITQGSPLT
ncbi:MAG TPA: hypothetical protein VK879_14470, partial [Candidatus Sulfomarinibacteraceae bacterium]|nr:hypothetical protein [Candidatus Sulfomarinibacteraceae bacterium]